MAEPVPGPVLFASYAFPPNSHGYCGPGDSGAFFEYGVAGADERGLRELARQFAGAWPYLQLIASATGLADPLDRRVVDAYWVGSERLNHVSTRAVGNSMEDRFRFLTGTRFPTLAESVLAGGVPHHSFAVSASTRGPACSATVARPSTHSPCWTDAGSGGVGSRPWSGIRWLWSRGR